MTKQDQHDETQYLDPETGEPVDMVPTEAPVEIEVNAQEVRDLAAFRKAIETGELEVEIDQAAIARRIAKEVMDSSDLEAALEGKPTWSAKESVGRAFELRGLHVNLSQFESNLPVYASVDAVDLSTGEVGLLNTGSSRQLATLYVMQRDHRFPVRVRITYARGTPTGANDPLAFELVEDEPEA